MVEYYYRNGATSMCNENGAIEMQDKEGKPSEKYSSRMNTKVEVLIMYMRMAAL